MVNVSRDVQLPHNIFIQAGVRTGLSRDFLRFLL